MLRLFQTDDSILIESFEAQPVLIRLTASNGEIIKAVDPGTNIVQMKGLPRIMDLHMLALAKADIAPLYVSRPVLNPTDIISWFRMQGFGQMVAPDDMHVTVCYSRQPVNWNSFGQVPNTIVEPATPAFRSLAALGGGPAVVLKFRSDKLQARHQSMQALGASHDWPEYQPHVTLSYNMGNRILESYQPFPGEIIFGPEAFADINTDKEFIEKSVHRKFTWDRRNGLREKQT